MYVLYVTLVTLRSGLAYPRFRLLTQVSVVAAGSHPCDCHVGTTSNRESYSSGSNAKPTFFDGFHETSGCLIVMLKRPGKRQW
jgi:hypothetical protein